MSDLAVIAKRALGLVDLTTLTDSEQTSDIVTLCRQAATPMGNTVALCLYPRFIPLARKILCQQGSEDIRLATVTNFPYGDPCLDTALAETRAAIAYGADEVDLVFPWRALLNGDNAAGASMVSACKQLCHEQGVLLKVILETGELKQPEVIRAASKIAIESGADFIKTSTGKVPVNATLAAAEVMLQTIEQCGARNSVGFKAAGGIRTTEEAANYISLAERIMGDGWVTPQSFRFGASGLLQDFLRNCGLTDTAADTGY